MKSKIIGIAAAAVALILGAAFFSASISKNKAEQNNPSAATNDSRSDQQLSNISVNPLLTYGDTDDERNYGYDVLYKHDGVTVMLIGSYFEGDSKDLAISITNDTDKKLMIYTKYVAANCYMSDALIVTDVEPKQTVECTIYDIAQYLERSAKIDDVELKFSLIFDDNYENAIYSDQIKIIYDFKDHLDPPRGDATLLWEADGFEVYRTTNEIMHYDDGDVDVLRQNYLFRNAGATDYYFKYTLRCYKGEKEIYENTGQYIEMPGGCEVYYHTNFIPDKPYNAKNIDRVVMSAGLYSFDGKYELIYSADDIEFEINS